MSSSEKTVLLAGGGTGGHIFPNLAVLERLQEMDANVRGHALVSERPIDATVLEPTKLPFTPLPARPLILRPRGLVRFLLGYRKSEAVMRQVIAQTQAKVLIATGGFVSAPAVSAARKAGLATAVVNLDAVPGRANRMMVKKATAVFSAYDTPMLPNAQPIGLPLRRNAVPSIEASDARQQLGLDPTRPTLLVTAGSQGAITINELMMRLCQERAFVEAASSWQVLHLAGTQQRDAVEQAYQSAEVAAKVVTFCEQMGLAWRAAELAISRAGAGSVAEVWANRVPTIFLPYPFHKDEHQRLNAQPLVDAQAAMMFRDVVDAPRNVVQLQQPIVALMRDQHPRETMRQRLAASDRGDGAAAVAKWVLDHL